MNIILKSLCIYLLSLFSALNSETLQVATDSHGLKNLIETTLLPQAVEKTLNDTLDKLKRFQPTNHEKLLNQIEKRGGKANYLKHVLATPHLHGPHRSTVEGGYAQWIKFPGSLDSYIVDLGTYSLNPPKTPTTPIRVERTPPITQPVEGTRPIGGENVFEKIPNETLPNIFLFVNMTNESDDKQSPGPEDKKSVHQDLKLQLKTCNSIVNLAAVCQRFRSPAVDRLTDAKIDYLILLGNKLRSTLFSIPEWTQFVFLFNTLTSQDIQQQLRTLDRATALCEIVDIYLPHTLKKENRQQVNRVLGKASDLGSHRDKWRLFLNLFHEDPSHTEASTFLDKNHQSLFSPDFSKLLIFNNSDIINFFLKKLPTREGFLFCLKLLDGAKPPNMIGDVIVICAANEECLSYVENTLKNLSPKESNEYCQIILNWVLTEPKARDKLHNIVNRFKN